MPSGVSTGRSAVPRIPVNGRKREAGWPRPLARFRTVLAIGAHPDDCEIGCGGSIAAAKLAGADGHVAALSRCEDEVFKGDKSAREKEFLLATKTLDVTPHLYRLPNREFPEHRQEIMRILEQMQEEIRPDLVFFPSLEDPHQDHNTVAEAVIRTFRRKETLLEYEILRHSSHTFTPTLFIDISSTLSAKLEALREYKSQIATRAYFDEESYRSLARTRGAQSGCEFAEGFMVYMMYL